MTPELPSLHLRPGSVKPLHSGHPWVFADAIASQSGPAPQPGDEVRVLDAHGKVLGRGFYSPHSAIAVRLLTRSDKPADAGLLRRRLLEAADLRRRFLGLGQSTTAYRLVHSEGDGLGGLVVDVYGDCLAVAIGTAGMERRREALLDTLEELLTPRAIVHRGDERVRELEHLPGPACGVLRGAAPAAAFEVLEDGIAQLADLRPGQSQKTGLYLDQRENRRRAAVWAAGRAVLDVFSYTGGFSLHAARAGAQGLVLLDSSEPALRTAQGNLERNGIADADLICDDWREGLRRLRQEGRRFGLAVVDPPKFARSKQHAGAALAAYRELNAQVVRLLEPGGVLCTCSCSGNVSTQDFERAVAGGLADAGQRAALIERRGAGPDHPALAGFEQGDYLKCLLLRLPGSVNLEASAGGQAPGTTSQPGAS